MTQRGVGKWRQKQKKSFTVHRIGFWFEPLFVLFFSPGLTKQIKIQFLQKNRTILSVEHLNENKMHHSQFKTKQLINTRIRSLTTNGRKNSSLGLRHE